MMHWEVKSQQTSTMLWTIESHICVFCATDDENEILTDKLVTYFKYGF